MYMRKGDREMNYAIILSGGIGTRMGLDVPKQYVLVNGKMILQYVIETIVNAGDMDGYVIVANEQYRERILAVATDALFLGFADPGANRQLSILSGLRKLSAVAKAEDCVLVQDAARPLTSGALMRDCMNAAAEHDGAIPVLPMKDTVYQSTDGKIITSLLKREQIFAGQAPEAFVYGKYVAANERLLPDAITRINGSTEPAILADMDIAMIPGDERNYKITTPEDLKRFERDLIGT